ncbi:hypothetical protein Pan258_08290 [Symmachiella dynata]|uniref:Uncharacterized protein n=1 Tax=Symmachiella dynata TaxID=2527995 RepID=A0A517ZIM3_9PLAN|nr:hypothetical protein [Symmachiella dynata]QDT46809.1 hypothetical protein Pan258_08290 [Symmachiella dynata]QDU42317.1 hypothetical protein Mal52_07730 [Symmachiella dynata]
MTKLTPMGLLFRTVCEETGGQGISRVGVISSANLCDKAVCTRIEALLADHEWQKCSSYLHGDPGEDWAQWCVVFCECGRAYLVEAVFYIELYVNDFVRIIRQLSEFERVEVTQHLRKWHQIRETC